MKKFISIIISILELVLSQKVNSQQVGSVWLNGAIGLNSNWILNQNAYGNSEMAYSTSLGFTGGIGVNLFNSRKWGMRSSFLMTKLGQNYSGDQNGAEAIRKVKLKKKRSENKQTTSEPTHK